MCVFVICFLYENAVCACHELLLKYVQCTRPEFLFDIVLCACHKLLCEIV